MRGAQLIILYVDGVAGDKGGGLAALFAHDGDGTDCPSERYRRWPVVRILLILIWMTLVDVAKLAKEQK